MLLMPLCESPIQFSCIRADEGPKLQAVGLSHLKTSHVMGMETWTFRPLARPEPEVGSAEGGIWYRLGHEPHKYSVSLLV